MPITKSKILLLGLLGTSMVLGGCGSKTETPIGISEKAISSKTVYIEETIAKNQDQIGFCWSYSIIGLLESLELQKGNTYNLSEEYLGYYHLLNQVETAINSSDPANELDEITEGFFAWPGMELMTKVGIVPESIFNKKFKTKGISIDDNIKAFFSKAIKDPAKLAEYRADRDLIYKDLANIFGASPIKPTDSFDYKGKTYTPVTFLKERLHFKLSNFENVEVKNVDPSEMEVAMHKLKVALMQKISIPFGVAVFDNISGNVWDTLGCEKSDEGCRASSGHAMLIADFLTRGGRFGDMPLSEVKDILNNPLSAILVKNSWGFQGVDQNNNSSTGKDTGYNIITRAYLQESLKVRPFKMVIPKSIYDNNGNFFYGAGLKTEIIVSPITELGTPVKLSAEILDLPKEVDVSIANFNWEIKNSFGNTVYRSTEKELKRFVASNAGVFTAELSTSVGDNFFRTSKKFWVASTENVFNPNSVLSTTNDAGVDFLNSIFTFDYTKPQIVEDLNFSIINLPAVTFEKSGKLEISYDAISKDGPIAKLEVSKDGIKYKPVICNTERIENISDPTVEEAYNYKCRYPQFGGFNTDEGSKVLFRIVGKQMPQLEHKKEGIGIVKNFKMLLAGARVERSYRPVLVTAKYPSGSNYKLFTTTGNKKIISGFFSSDTERVNVYVDSKLAKVVNLVDNNVNFEFTPILKGVYNIRLVGSKNNKESSYVEYKVYATTPIHIKNGEEKIYELKHSQPFIVGEWVNQKHGLGAEILAKKLANNMYSTSTFSIDLSNNINPQMSFVIYQNLEKDFDFLFIKISKDGGRTFKTLLTDTGAKKGRLETYSLAKYAGYSNVIVKIDAVTDLGEESKYLIFGKLLLTDK